MKRRKPFQISLYMKELLPFIDAFLKKPNKKTLMTLRFHIVGVAGVADSRCLLGCPKGRGGGWYSECSCCSHIVNFSRGANGGCVMYPILRGSCTRHDELLYNVAEAHLYLSEHRDLLATRPFYDRTKKRSR